MSQTPPVQIIDHNGTGDWSEAAILRRYRMHCRSVGIQPRPLAGRRMRQGERLWISPVLDAVIEGVRQHDAGCIAIGVELIEADDFMPFGRLHKSRMARELRRVDLDERLRERLRARIVAMLKAGNVPHEFRHYVRLLKSIGFEDCRADIAGAQPDNRYVRRWVRYLLDIPGPPWHEARNPGCHPPNPVGAPGRQAAGKRSLKA
ncbi:hypothetical protein [Phreatobacter sp.]|uniref:hypothetical protein n=1 Tax=Phreatobacter sp. TaxID=1966341 RepID=UPI003F6E9F15